MKTKVAILNFGLISSIFILSGCSDGPPRYHSSSGGSSDSTSGAGGGGGAGNGSGGGQSGVGGSGAGQGGGGQGGQASGAGGGGDTSNDLFPLALGYQWDYDVQLLGAGDPCGGPDTKTVVLTMTTLDGKDGFNVDYFCATPLVFHAEGDFVEYNQGMGWKTLLVPPVNDGDTFTCYDGAACTWKKLGPVTVPAGTFANCWMVQLDVGDGGTRERTYCRGVGQVKSFYMATDGNGYNAQLISKNF